MMTKHQTYTSPRVIDAYHYVMYRQEVIPTDYGVIYHRIELDDYGIPQLRHNCHSVCYDSSGVLRDAGEWSSRCLDLLRYHRPPHKVVTHVYIFSWPPADAAKLSLDKLIAIGTRICRERFPGHECLVSAHMDKDHPHIHITVLGLRTLNREPQDWMLTNKKGDVLPCEVNRGYVHHHTAKFEHALYDILLDISREYGLDDTDFRITMKNNRDLRIAECTKTLQATLGDIICDHPCGLPYEALVEELETRCSAHLSKDKDGYRVKFGAKGKAYPLESYDIRDNAIDITVGDLFATPAIELTSHQKGLREALLTSAHGAATIRDLRERLHVWYGVDLLTVGDKMYLRPCWENVPVPVDSLGVSSRDLSRYLLATRQGQMELLRRKGADLGVSSSVCDDIYHRVAAWRDDPATLWTAYRECLRLAQAEAYHLRRAARDLLWEEHRQAMEQIYAERRLLRDLAILPANAASRAVGWMLPHMLMVSPLVAAIAIAIVLGLSVACGLLCSTIDDRASTQAAEERQYHKAYLSCLDGIADLAGDRDSLTDTLATAARLHALLDAAYTEQAELDDYPGPIPMRHAICMDAAAYCNPPLAPDRGIW